MISYYFLNVLAQYSHFDSKMFDEKSCPGLSIDMNHSLGPSLHDYSVNIHRIIVKWHD